MNGLRTFGSPPDRISFGPARDILRVKFVPVFAASSTSFFIWPFRVLSTAISTPVSITSSRVDKDSVACLIFSLISVRVSNGAWHLLKKSSSSGIPVFSNGFRSKEAKNSVVGFDELSSISSPLFCFWIVGNQTETNRSINRISTS